VASGWQNKLSRLSRMNWEEVKTRLGQEAHKRSDLLRHRLGFHPEAIQLDASATPIGSFFFSSSEVRQRSALIRQHLPEQAHKIVTGADEICHHRFRLLGYELFDYGRNIDWHLDAVHGKRAPLEPWPKINFLDFAAVGDHKVTWELNRHQHLVTLAKAWRLTGEEKYVRELTAQWRHWIEANPYPLGINWGSTLEVAFRSLSWIWVDHLLAENTGQADGPSSRVEGVAEFRAELLPALAFHGRYIERYLSTYFSPNTHLLGEAVAMFFLGTLYPQMPHASRWKSHGWELVLHEAGRQVRPDGVYFEQSLHYHVYALDFFLCARLLSAANGTLIPSVFDATLQRMLNVVQALAQAGTAEGFGDDDGGRLFNPRRNRTEHMTDPLAIGALAYNREDLAAQLTEESIWLFGEHAVAKLTQTTTPSTATSTSFPDGGLYVLADTLIGSDSKQCTQAMMIDAGPQGIGRCGHGHADALSVRLTMDGSRWLVDSGSGVYISDDPQVRNTFRGTAAHNTLLVNGEDQAVPDEPFSWTNIPTTRVENWITGETFTYFAGSHNGYERLAERVTHHRSVLRINGGDNGIWWIRDSALGSAEHDLELNWHFAPGLSVREEGPAELLVSRPESEQLSLRMMMPAETSWKTSVSQGLLSPCYGRYEPAPVVQCKIRGKLPTEITTAFLAQTETSQTKSKARMVSKQDRGVHAYELDRGDEIHELFFGSNRQNWTLGPWASDAEVFYYRTDHEKIIQLIIIGGTTVTWQGQPLVRASKPSPFLEWRKQDGVRNGGGGLFFVSPLLNDLAATLAEKP
jgi:Heparinase II/III-like protein/Heparinase II/III N-terminus